MIQSRSEFNLLRIIRLSTFQIGSAMGDILTASVWNRILISDFGIPAWPVGLLIALRYFISPLSIWAGHRSDVQALLGYHRTSYIWLGRGLMVLSFPLLGASTVRLESAPSEPAGWLLAVLCFLLFGFGKLLSGSPFLALVRDSVPREKQGVAIAMVETALIALFPIVAVLFSRLLVTYDAALFWRLIAIVTVVGGFFWFFAVLGVERRGQRREVAASPEPIGQTFQLIWSDPRTRRFFYFLSLATFAAWMQDNILEPYGAEVFQLGVDQTTRLTGYWGAGTVVVLLASFVIWRSRYPSQQVGVSRVGLLMMAAGILFVGVAAFWGQTPVFYIALILFGAGFGFYTFGGLSLMAAMSPDPNAGAYLGLWTISILVSKGIGTAMGGILRDIFLQLGLTPAATYALIFAISAVGLLGAALLVGIVDVPGFARENNQPIEEMPAVGMAD